MNTPLRRSGMARVLKGSCGVTCTPRIRPLTEWTILAFSFSAEVHPHVLTLKGWRRLSWPGQPPQYYRPQAQPVQGQREWNVTSDFYSLVCGRSYGSNIGLHSHRCKHL